jgi:hypothetical protein
MELVPIGIAARQLGISRERLKTLADAGRVRGVVRDTLGRRFVDAREVERMARARQKQSQREVAEP